MYRGLRHPIEAFRTAPAQLAAVMLNTSVATGVAANALDVERVYSTPVEMGLVVANLGFAALNAILAENKIRLRDRLELNLSNNGFNDRVMSTTMGTYCTRQAAKIACENTGHAEEYAALLKQKPDKGDTRWLPHI